MEIYGAFMVTMRNREQNVNYDKITIVVIPTIVLIVLSVPQSYLQTNFQCRIITKWGPWNYYNIYKGSEDRSKQWF